MTSRARTVLAIVLIGLFAGVTGTIAWAAYSIRTAGTISVEVREGGSNHISIRVPAGIVTAAMALVPGSCLREASRELEPYWPAVLAAYEALEDLPDAVFVEVESGDELVRIGKEGGEFYLRVDGGSDRVYLRFPLRVVRPALRKLVRIRPDLQSAGKVKISISDGAPPAI